MMTVMTNGGGQDGMWTDERGRAEVDGRIAACCRNGYVPPTGISTTPRRRRPGRPRRAYGETAAKQERKRERHNNTAGYGSSRGRSTGARTQDTCFRCYVRACACRDVQHSMYRCCCWTDLVTRDLQSIYLAAYHFIYLCVPSVI